MKKAIIYFLVFLSGWWVGKLWEIVPFLIRIAKEGQLEYIDGRWAWVFKFTFP